jgi:hypothetical protein
MPFLSLPSTFLLSFTVVGKGGKKESGSSIKQRMTDVIYTAVLGEVYLVLDDQDLYLIDVMPCDRHICCIFVLVSVSIYSTAISSTALTFSALCPVHANRRWTSLLGPVLNYRIFR